MKVIRALFLHENVLKYCFLILNEHLLCFTQDLKLKFLRNISQYTSLYEFSFILLLPSWTSWTSETVCHKTWWTWNVTKYTSEIVIGRGDNRFYHILDINLWTLKIPLENVTSIRNCIRSAFQVYCLFIEFIFYR